MKKILSLVISASLLSTMALSGCVNITTDETESVLSQVTSTESSDDGSVEFVHSQNPEIEVPSTCPLSQSQVDSIVKNAEDVLAQYENFSGTVLMSVGNQIIYEESFGNTDAKGKTKNENDTYYQIGSLTKQFTGAAVLMLEKEGKLKTTDTLEKYFPEYDCEYMKTVTIEHLLEMTAGMGDYMAVIEGNEETLNKYLKAAGKSEDAAKDFIVDIIFEDGLYTDPGIAYNYSNSSYYLLGIIIEQVTGMSYKDYLQQNFFDAAGMTDTYFVGDGKDNQTGYSFNEGKYVSDNDNKYLKAEGDYPYLFSAGSVVSTAEDMNKWLDVIVAGDIITESDRSKVEKSLSCYNYGWNTAEGSWHHSGRTYAYSSQIYVDYKTDTKLVILTNISFYSDLNEISYKIFNPMMAAVNKVQK